jgi:hypothetical protein
MKTTILLLTALASVVIYAFAHSSSPAYTTSTASASTTPVYHWNGKTAEEIQSGATPTPTPTPFQPFLTDEQKAKGETLATVEATPTPLVKGASEEVVYIGAADETHLFFGIPDQRYNYDSDPVAYSKGWKLGWQWATSKGTVGDDAVIEKAERKHWKDTDSTPALAFFDAAATYRRIGQSKEEATAGAPPSPGGWNQIAGGWRTEQAVKDTLNDPGSYQLVRSFQPVHDKFNGTPCWRVKLVFRARNAFNGYVQGAAYVYEVTDSEHAVSVLGIEQEH